MKWGRSTDQDKAQYYATVIVQSVIMSNLKCAHGVNASHMEAGHHRIALNTFDMIYIQHCLACKNITDYITFDQNPISLIFYFVIRLN